MAKKAGAKPGFGRVALAIVGIFGGMALVSKIPPSSETAATRQPVTETYRLIHAIGNTEQETARGLSKADCDIRKKELIAVSEALGVHNEKAGYGSVTCLPESYFQ
ncbi:hypothetical protein [Neorhizobium sp. NCHU2750]|uniref:hypothetical protein n=1 Tax=Neorhizobium sp. NCHU2750 TaxID=1825976 RepID=UPI000E7677CD